MDFLSFCLSIQNTVCAVIPLVCAHAPINALLIKTSNTILISFCPLDKILSPFPVSLKTKLENPFVLIQKELQAVNEFFALEFFLHLRFSN